MAATPATGASQQRIMLGAFANQDGQSSINDPAAAEADTLALEASIGRKLAIDSQYTSFAGFNSTTGLVQAVWDAGRGVTPMLTWGFNTPGHPCPKWYQIQEGDYDAQLIDQAQAFKAIPGRIIVRYLPAMDTTYHACPYDGVDPVADPITAGPRFIAMWRHVVDLMHAQGATNIIWDWSPGVHAFSDNHGNPVLDANGNPLWEDFYPGDTYVDYMGTQMYQPSPTNSGFDTDPIFLTWYGQAVTKGKPLFFSEMAALGPDQQYNISTGRGCMGGDTGLIHSPASTWIISLRNHMATQFPALQGFVWFSEVANDPTSGTCFNYTLRDGRRRDALYWFSRLGAHPEFTLMTPP